MEPLQDNQKPIIRMPVDQSENIMATIQKARVALVNAGLKPYADDIVRRLLREQEAKSYDQAIDIILEYVRDEAFTPEEELMEYLSSPPEEPGEPVELLDEEEYREVLEGIEPLTLDDEE